MTDALLRPGGDVMAGLQFDERITTSLVVRVLDGDDVGWERLLALYSPSVDRLMHDWRVPAVDRDAVRNHVFAEAFSSLSRFVGEHGSKSFLAWLWTIARRQVRSMAESERARLDRAAGGDAVLQALNECPAAPSSDDYAEVLRQVLRQASLSESEIQLLTLYHIEGLPAVEVGRRLDLSEVNVRTRFARMLKHIRDELGDLESWLLGDH